LAPIAHHIGLADHFAWGIAAACSASTGRAGWMDLTRRSHLTFVNDVDFDATLLNGMPGALLAAGRCASTSVSFAPSD
jgi:hypothetical protein